MTIFCLLNFKISSHFFSKSTFKKCCKINVSLPFHFIFSVSVTMLTIFLYICYFFKYRHTIRSLVFQKPSKIKTSIKIKPIFLRYLWRYFLFSLCCLKYRHIVTLMIFLLSICFKSLVNSTFLAAWYFYFCVTIFKKNIVTHFIFSSMSI